MTLSREARHTRIEAVRTLAAEGLKQEDIAERLGLTQSHVSKIMRANKIVRSQADTTYITRGETVYGNGMTVSISVAAPGEPIRVIVNASPEQLRQLADYADTLAP